MPRQSVYDMDFNKVYAALVAKAEKKGRTRDVILHELPGERAKTSRLTLLSSRVETC